MHIPRSRGPAPAVTGAIEPPPIMKRSPTPGIVIHPCPSIKVRPNPAAITVRRPTRVHVRSPYRPIGGHVYPTAIRIEIAGAGDIWVYILIATGAGQALIAAPVPAVEIVLFRRANHLKLGVGGGSAHHHGIAFMERLGATRGVDFRITLTRGDLGAPVVEYRHAVSSTA